MPDYGSKSYWDTRYQTVETSFDWMVDYAAISRTLEPLLPDKDASILIVGCGDAPFSADLYYIGGYLNQLNVDYSEVVIEKQRKLWPEICWKVMDCLDMKDIAENSLDVVIDKSLIDTCLCYEGGYNTTMKLYSELHRVLKPGGRLITISLHSEDEVLQFGSSKNATCEFISSSCSIISERESGGHNTLCVFDKVKGLDVNAKSVIVSEHPIEFAGSAIRKTSLPAEHLSSSNEDDDSVDYHFGFITQDDLLHAFGQALDDVFNVA